MIRIHSIAEAYLLLMATPCPSCGKGPLQEVSHEPAALPGSPAQSLLSRCQSCGHEQAFLFDMADVRDAGSQTDRNLPQINPSQEPSHAIDLGQWLILFEMIVRAADRQTNPVESRRLGYEAAQCLEEALKFYPLGDSDWPEESAFFHDWTLDRFRRHRHRFARTRLVELRRKLPTLTQMELRLIGKPDQIVKEIGTVGTSSARRPWWAFWR